MSRVRQPRSETKVVVCVGLALLACEVALRVAEPRLSIELAHYSQLPATFERLANAAGERVLVLGNSLVRDGIDEERLEGRLNATRPATLAVVHPGDTSIVEWRLLLEEHVLAGSPAGADTVVLGYGHDQLSDRGSIQARRLGGHYASLTTLPRLLARETTSFDEQAQLLLAYGSRSFALANRVRIKTLETLVPGFRDAAQRFNQATGDPKTGPIEAPASTPTTYERLDDLLRQANDAGVRVVLVAVACGRAYGVDGRLLAVAAEHGVEHLDARDLPGVTRENFPDGYHMDAAARGVFTDLLADRLSR